ncbi:MAG: tRNA (guanosine(37)-N1)-methyltransferase TrmD [Caldithrix sp. RBG_13_44_9]|nr:MAG: tRNA (guanosine(37)-N1)-methyltransferase TrmD [Caldithrix sp. RBG_13_44_9]
MRIDVITVFPKILADPLNESILKQARKRIDLQINLVDLRDFSSDKHRTVDDTPYGGGPGMILKPEPLFASLEDVFRNPKDQSTARVIFPTPQGKLFTQQTAEELSEIDHLVFICGHYKAIDQRVIDSWVTDEISIGDFILSGGEIAVLLMVDAIVRLRPGVLSDIDSAKTDSFQNSLLDCPYYTRPEVFKDLAVPEVLVSGHHQKIEEWRLNQKIERTRLRRPDLYEKYLTDNVEQQKKKKVRRK